MRLKAFILMTPTSISIAMTKSLGDASLILILILSFHFAMREHVGGHFSGNKTIAKILQSGFYWPTLHRDTFIHCKNCHACQQLGAMSKRNMMPLNPILEIEIFDCWGIDFMGPFPPSNGFAYILVCIDYVSKWVEALPCRTNDAAIVLRFLKNDIFARYGVPKAIISDGGSHFCNRLFQNLMKRFGVNTQSLNSVPSPNQWTS